METRENGTKKERRNERWNKTKCLVSWNSRLSWRSINSASWWAHKTYSKQTISNLLFGTRQFFFSFDPDGSASSVLIPQSSSWQPYSRISQTSEGWRWWKCNTCCLSVFLLLRTSILCSTVPKSHRQTVERKSKQQRVFYSNILLLLLPFHPHHRTIILLGFLLYYFHRKTFCLMLGFLWVFYLLLSHSAAEIVCGSSGAQRQFNPRRHASSNMRGKWHHDGRPTRHQLLSRHSHSIADWNVCWKRDSK